MGPKKCLRSHLSSSKADPSNIEKEKFKHKPAICMLREPIKCVEAPKYEINEGLRFFSLGCTLKCAFSMHNSCWRSFKAHLQIRTDKEAFDQPCITPDCKGLINHVLVVKEKGEVVEVKRTDGAGSHHYHQHHGWEGDSKAMAQSSVVGAIRADANRRTVSESENLECKSSGAVASQDLSSKVRDLQKKIFAQSNELRDFKTREEKMTKEIERLRNEKAKLLSQTLQVDNCASEATTKTNYEKILIQKELDTALSRVHVLTLDNQQLTKNLSKTRDFCDKLLQDVAKLKSSEEFLEQHLQSCGNRDQMVDSVFLAVKKKLLDLQADQATEKAIIELIHSLNNIKAIDFLISFFEPHGISEWTSRNGGWSKLKSNLLVHKMEYEEYSKNVQLFIDDCENRHKKLSADLRVTGQVGDLTLTLNHERPRLIDLPLIEELLVLLHDKVVKEDGDQVDHSYVGSAVPSTSGVATSGVATPGFVTQHSEKLNSRLMKEFPLLSYEQARGYVDSIQGICRGSFEDLDTARVIRFVGQILSQQQPLEVESPIDAIKWTIRPTVTMFSTFENCEECSICIELMTAKEETKLECGHKFHTSCIRLWLREKRDCPMCRHYAVQEDEFPTVGSN